MKNIFYNYIQQLHLANYLLIICLHMSYLHLQFNSQKQFCTDNSIHSIGHFL